MFHTNLIGLTAIVLFRLVRSQALPCLSIILIPHTKLQFIGLRLSAATNSCNFRKTECSKVLTYSYTVRLVELSITVFCICYQLNACVIRSAGSVFVLCLLSLVAKVLCNGDVNQVGAIRQHLYFCTVVNDGSIVSNARHLDGILIIHSSHAYILD